MVAQCVSAGTTAEGKIGPGAGREGLRLRRGLPSGYLTPRSGALPFGPWFPALTHWATILRPCRGLAFHWRISPYPRKYARLIGILGGDPCRPLSSFRPYWRSRLQLWLRPPKRGSSTAI